MKNNVIQDERAVALKRQISSEAFNLVMGALVISLLVKQYVLDVPFSQSMTEILCLSGAALYVLVRNIIAGNNVYESKKGSKKSLIYSSLAGGLGVCLSAGIFNYAKYSEKYANNWMFLAILAILFVSGSLFVFFMYLPIYKINQKRQKMIDSALDQDEDDI